MPYALLKGSDKHPESVFTIHHHQTSPNPQQYFFTVRCNKIVSHSRSDSLPRPAEGGYQTGGITAQWPVKVVNPRWKIPRRAQEEMPVAGQSQVTLQPAPALEWFFSSVPFLPHRRRGEAICQAVCSNSQQRSRESKDKFLTGRERLFVWAQRLAAPCWYLLGYRSSRTNNDTMKLHFFFFSFFPSEIVICKEISHCCIYISAYQIAPLSFCFV